MRQFHDAPVGPRAQCLIPRLRAYPPIRKTRGDLRDQVLDRIAIEHKEDRRVMPAPRSKNIAWVEHRVSTAERTAANGHRGGILWMTGLPGSGKTTLACELERALFLRGYKVFLLDGDNVRHGLSSDLGFSPADRAENIRRVGEVAGLCAEAGVIAISAFISPYRADRDGIRERRRHDFHEIFVSAPLEVCESRDPKGHYRKARAGELPDFTGISSPYEPPLAPELMLETHRQTIEACVIALVQYADSRFRVPRPERVEGP